MCFNHEVYSVLNLLHLHIGSNPLTNLPNSFSKVEGEKLGTNDERKGVPKIGRMVFFSVLNVKILNNVLHLGQRRIYVSFVS